MELYFNKAPLERDYAEAATALSELVRDAGVGAAKNFVAERFLRHRMHAAHEIGHRMMITRARDPNRPIPLMLLLDSEYTGVDASMGEPTPYLHEAAAMFCSHFLATYKRSLVVQRLPGSDQSSFVWLVLMPEG